MKDVGVKGGDEGRRACDDVGRQRHGASPVLWVWGQLIIRSWESCGAKKMAHARHLTVDRYKKCYSLYRFMPNFRFFSDLGGKTAFPKFAKNEFVSTKLAK